MDSVEQLYSKKDFKRVLLLFVGICLTTLATLFYVLYYNQIRIKAMVGALYDYDKEAAESLVYILFRGTVKEDTLQLGNEAIKAAGYTENGFHYIQDLGFGNTSLKQIFLFVFIIIVVLILFVIKELYRYANVCNELFQRNKDLKKKLDSYQKSSERRQQQLQDFVENIAHQIKTTMAAISLNLDVIKMDGKYDDDSVEDCFIYINRVNTFLKRLLYISRMESGKVIMTSQKVLLKDVLTQALALSGIEKEKVTIHMEGTIHDYSFYADEQWIGEAIINILVNSYEFIKEKLDGKIMISAVQKEDKCIISISDNGDGIKIEDIEHIFDRFRTTKTPLSFHVGIGLNLAKLIIEAHHGSIYASNSHEYGGAQFRITIPRYFMLSEKTIIEK